MESGNTVRFQMRLAYRKNYDWGVRFGEQCASADQVFKTQGCEFNELPEYYQTVANYLRFPVGMDFDQKPLTNGRLCISPWDNGDYPTCGQLNPEGTPVANQKFPAGFNYMGEELSLIHI